MAAYVFETITAAQAAAYAAGDTLSFQSAGASGAAVTVAYLAPEQIGVTLGGLTATFSSAITNQTGATFPDGSLLYVGGLANDAFTGTAFGDGLFGGQGADSLSGAAGADLLQGNQGADSLSGGAGNDTIYGGQDDDTIDVGAGSNFGQGNKGADTITASAEAGANTLLGGQGDDVVRGGDSADTLFGNLGNDSVSGGGGADLISGEGGADTLDGGAGADTFLAAAGSSDASFAGSDQILHWSREDRIDVAGSGGVAAYYQIPSSQVGGGDPYDPYDPGSASPMGTAISYSQALSTSNTWLRGHTTNNISTAQIPEGVAVFVDSDGDHVADLSIILVGASIFDVSADNFI